MKSIASFLALALLPAATHADAAPPVSCIFTGESSKAPFYVRFDNQHVNSVKIRMCPKQFTKCTGDPTLPNSYIDCNATLPASATTAVFLNTGIGYIVAVANGTEPMQVNPLLPGGLQWPAVITLAK